MPKIRIIENDLTGIQREVGISNTVFVPGVSTVEAVDWTTFIEEHPPVLCTTEKQLKAISGIDDSTLSFRLAKHLINLGMYVLYGLLPSGSTTVPSQMWTDVIVDKSLYDVRFLTTGGLGYVDQDMVDCATKRGDCIALVDHPRELALGENKYLTLTTQPSDWKENFNSYYKYDGTNYISLEAETSAPTFTYDPTDRTKCFFEQIATGSKDVKAVRSYFDTILNGEYAAGFTPWFTSTNSDLIETEDEAVAVPATFGYLFAYARSIKNNPQWFAAAGSDRGIISELTGVLHEYSTAECEILQARGASSEVELDDSEDNIGIAINPIALVKPYGYVVWGNRTLIANTSKGLIATSFLNIRNMISMIKKQLYNTARKYTFQQNSDILWLNFKSAVTPLLEEMQYSEGLQSYRFVRQTTSYKGRLKAKLRIIPIEAVEDFDLTLELADTLDVSE